MQALIDFDGWRKWKDFSTASTSTGSADASASGAAPSATSQANGAPTKTKRKPVTIRRKKDSIDKTERKGPVDNKESVISRAMSPANRSRDDSGTTDAEGRKSESGASSSPSVRDKSSSDAGGGSAGPLLTAQSAENGMSSVPEQHVNGTTS